MFTYPVKRTGSANSFEKCSRRKMEGGYEVDIEQFRKKIGIFIRNDPVVDSFVRSLLEGMVRNIKMIAGVDPDLPDTDYSTDESVLLANADEAAEAADAIEKMKSSKRKTLALKIMKVFREHVANMDVQNRVFYASSTLSHLEIPKNRWAEYYLVEVLQEP